MAISTRSCRLDRSSPKRSTVSCKLSSPPCLRGDVYPVRDTAGQDDSTFFVDVGGGHGQQCEALLAKHPGIRGKVILQNKPEVVKAAKLSPRIVAMAHDFFTEQPIKGEPVPPGRHRLPLMVSTGAKIYYFRQIFHNYPDEQCQRILRAHLPALSQDSVILIDEKVLADTPDQVDLPATSFEEEYIACLDLAMYSIFQAKERRLSQWKALLESSGYELVETKQFIPKRDSVIVAKRRSEFKV